MRRKTLALRLSLVTMAGAAVAIWALLQGLVTPIFANDISRLSYVTVGLFVLGLASTFWQALTRCSPARIAHIHDISAWLQVLGLLGTVIGFSIALSGIEVDNTTTIISGLRTAIGTTILGGILSLWTAINYRMLDTAAAGDD